MRTCDHTLKEGVRLRMSPRQCVTVGFRLRDTRTDGRFFDSAQNDMSCNNNQRILSVRYRQKIVILRRPCLPCPAQAGVRPTKDLLRHRIMPKRLAFGPTGQAARPPSKQNGSSGRFFDYAQNDMFCNNNQRNVSGTRRNKQSC